MECLFKRNVLASVLLLSGFLALPCLASETTEHRSPVKQAQPPELGSIPVDEGEEKGIGNSFRILWSTFDGGGAIESTGGSLWLSGTVGQTEDQTQVGGTLALSGGFWNKSSAGVNFCGSQDVIFCNGFESGDTSAWTSQ